ncbi:MAG: prepilin-type N-terminal cleavage/methylation domain-containing protein, partial [Gemmatimonadetes bacterium]|nr:prepilin-type N-terminal cleavage/methylation domain-containing protein [Gemmatimonadota bacterium]NIQ56241.1 prepilin-type N-terminal cleavage/methylation domain-containing protein [Gemmatimonadota bacterium]NIU76429.1 prepilin-type N-terminal cleavage/methylation domain-containing protein [Gammaproteobacteria bacterium]NIX45906.1 prepilin-type N-terminal cleavage/methylation domain-containing protein [Gemmatimonadota bacterium]NIY10218.1 prepilin-type N-terminal cleavage/methylation domain
MNRDGFSLVEIIVGMLILVVGVLGLASSTGFVAMQIEAADLRTERTVAYQQVAERLRSADFDNVQSRAPG